MDQATKRNHVFKSSSMCLLMFTQDNNPNLEMAPLSGWAVVLITIQFSIKADRGPSARADFPSLELEAGKRAAVTRVVNEDGEREDGQRAGAVSGAA